MKIAYLTSRYPDVSHTFILREVEALRARGLEISTYSVRRATATNILGPTAEKAAASTRWLVPPPIGEFLTALIWMLFTRPVRALQTLTQAIGSPGLSLRQRFQWLLYFGEATLLAYWMHADGIDRLHCHFGNSGSSTGMLAARLARRAFSLTCHGSELREIHRYRLVEKIRQADFVACVSHYGRAQLMLACPPEQWDKLHVVRCGVPEAERAEPEVADGPLRVLCVGRLSPEKGHLVLLEALALLQKEGVELEATLVGDGPTRSLIEARAAKLRLTSRLTLTGSLPPTKVSDLYRFADVVALASFSEGVPVVLMEAMARGRPVVATCVGGVPELVEDGQSGLIVPPGDAVALAGALRRIGEDSELARRLGENGARRVRRHFDGAASADRLIGLFEANNAGVSPCASRKALGGISVPVG